jgi:hypothetical protein
VEIIEDKTMEEATNYESSLLSQQLKQVILEREKQKQAQVQQKASGIYIFSPKTDLEEAAIAIATQGELGWKEALYSLDYTDRHLEHTCFIFATRPEGSKEEQWLLVNLDGRSGSKYWIALGEKQLSDVYYAWAKVVQKTAAHFDPQCMMLINSTE